VQDVDGLVGFLRQVFDASGDAPKNAPAMMMIGDSPIMVSDGGGLRPETPAFLYVYMQDADATYARAIARGATSIEPPSDQAHGDRRAMVEDRWGNVWQIATHRGRG
jgi:uncharacterized glyoxalase superfamily protein PhnB